MNPQHREIELPDDPDGEQELPEELLMHRVVMGEANDADWDRLEATAATQPELWETVVRTMRVQATLQRAMDEALSAAEEAELPPAKVMILGRSAAWISLSGWAAAVLVLAAWFGAMRGAPGLQEDGLPGEGVTTAARDSSPGARQEPEGNELVDPAQSTPDSGSGASQPEFVQDLPSQVLATRPTGDGSGVEVTYVKRQIERVRLDQVYGLAVDETGQTKAVAVSASRLAALQRF